MVLHVLNRGVARMQLFEKPADYQAFEQVFRDTLDESPMPIDVPADWLERVNRADDEQDLESLRRSMQRARPFGQPEWQKEIAKRLDRSMPFGQPCPLRAETPGGHTVSCSDTSG